MSNEYQDTLFSRPEAQLGDFRFDERVVKVFPDMIARSVPGYPLITPSIALLARRYAQPNSRIYDLGCSLGAATLAIRRAVQTQGIRIIAVDNSEAMIKRCCQLVAEDNSVIPVDVSLGDIEDTDIDNASVVVLNFTLQFLEPKNRQALISRIAEGLRQGGILILSEKIRFSDEGQQNNQTDWHHDFKRAQGYSDLEIAQKRSALENVMKPDTEADHMRRLTEAGFANTYRWFQCFNFASYIAIK